MKIHLTLEEAVAIKIYETDQSKKHDFRTLQSRVWYEKTALTSIKGKTSIVALKIRRLLIFTYSGLEGLPQFIDSNVTEPTGKKSKIKTSLWIAMTFIPGRTLMKWYIRSRR